MAERIVSGWSCRIRVAVSNIDIRYIGTMLNGRDIFVLAALSIDPSRERRTIRSISEDLGIPHAGVQRSVARLSEAGLYLPRRGAVVESLAMDLMTTGARFLVPPKYLGQGGGTPTAWYGGLLASRIRSVGKDLPVVWPDPRGRVHGLYLEPLDPRVPDVARARPELGELMRAVDASRIGGAREREVADQLVREIVGGAQWAVA